MSDERPAADPAVPGHRIVRLLGQGGMGRVYLAEDTALGRTVAIKLVSELLGDRPEAKARFLREARSMATVEHPRVVRVYSFGETATGMPYFVMEYVEGEALAERLRRGRLEPAEALRLVEEIVDGLEAAAEKGVVHRDVKPANVLLDRRGHAHVADFGLAKATVAEQDRGLTETGAILGTPYYVSPEQARGRPVDLRSDIYSLGIVAFEMLSGDRPFDGTSSFEVVAKHLHEPLPDLRARRPDAPPALRRAIEWMTEKDPASRPPSYGALRQALRSAAAPSPAAPVSAARTPPRRMAARLGPTAALFATATAALYFVGRARSPELDPKQLVVAIAPFYGVDPESAREGRTMAGLVEREVVRRLGADGARVLGVDETQQAVRDHAAARALGERLSANVVVWGDAYFARGETEIEPSFTLVPRARPEPSGTRAARAGPDPTEVLRDLGTAAPGAPAARGGQVELRRTTAAGLGDLVLLLAGMHRLYNEGDAEPALALFERAPRSAQSLRLRGEALQRLGRGSAAAAALREAVDLDPRDAQAHAALGDVLLDSDRLAEAAVALRRAAQLGGPYSTRNGIVFEGRLFVREKYVGFYGSGSEPIRLDSGYLIAVDPASGRVLERHRPPGISELSLSVRGGVLRIDFVEPLPGTATFAGGRFEKPVFLSSSMLSRRRGWTSGRALATNFFVGDVWRERPTAERVAWAPATLADLEAALRRARERDPTQPWLPLLLGQALHVQGRADEAERAFSDSFEAPYLETPYYEYSMMARFLEQAGHAAWADRAYAEALARRKRIPQPIGQTTLIERLINAQFVLAAAEASRQGGDKARAHLWLARARELSGPCPEGESLAAAAWESYFRRHGDLAAARREREVVERARSLPGNYEALSGLSDVAVQSFLATSLGGGLFVLSLLLRAPRGTRFADRLALIASGEKRVLAVATALALAGFGFAVSARVSSRSIEEAPLSLMDGMGSAENVSCLERRIAEVGSREVRVGAALANHSAGNLERALEHYRSLEDEPRVSRNRNSLSQGQRTPPEPMTPLDFFRAHAEQPWSVWRESIRGIPFPPRILTLGLLAFLGIALAGRAPATTASPGRSHPWRPGSADLARGAPGRAYGAGLLLAFSVVVGAFQAIVHLGIQSSVPCLGPIQAQEAISFRGFPMPFSAPVAGASDAEFERAVGAFYWDFLRARPEVLVLWIAAALSGAIGLGLHVQALRSLRGAPHPGGTTEPAASHDENAETLGPRRGARPERG